MRRGFWVRARNQAAELSVEDSDIAEAKESKTVKVKIQSHVDHILRCDRHRSLWVLTTGPDNQSASLQINPAAFASHIAGEETRVVAGQIVVASPRQCACSQCPDPSAVLGRKENRRAGRTSLFNWLRVTFFFSPTSRESSRGPALKTWRSSKWM